VGVKVSFKYKIGCICINPSDMLKYIKDVKLVREARTLWE